MNFPKKNILFLVILLLGAFLRFSYLTWGYPFFFHPDENNITNAISHMSFSQLNPHFFAYGGLPIYTSFLLSFLVGLGKPSFSEIAYTLRFISASLSLLILPSLFYIGSHMFGKKTGLITFILSSVSIGFIQFAHFGTFEMWLAFFTLWLFYALFLLYKNPSLKYLILCSILIGILLSVKVSSIVFISLPPLILLLTFKSKKKRLLFFAMVNLCIVGVFYVLTNPFLIFDTLSFVNSLSYESSVALGTFPVFYTQSFIHTIPVFFQLRFILPFLLNPFVFVLFLFSLFYFVLFVAKQKKMTDIFLLLFLCITFFSQAFLFVKWTRYIIPILPFVYLLIGRELGVYPKKITVITTSLFFTISLILSIAFITMTYATDSRIAANAFALSHLSKQQAIVEPYDLGAIPFNTTFPDAKIINIYDIEKDPLIQQDLSQALAKHTVFLSTSQRLIHSRLTDTKDFPKGNMLYTDLHNGSLGYHLVYQTPCNFWCMSIYTGNPLSGSVEETATVFDHPFVSIFQK